MRTKRFEGRLFAESGCLFMVVAVNESEGTARVSCRLDGQPVVLDMPLTEVSRRISASAGIQLDNLNGPDSKRRLQSQDDGWHFSTREGLMGPYPSEKDAARELARYVLSMQTVPNPSRREGVPRPGSASHAPRRRSSDRSEAVHATG
ncbi:MAG: DUF6316 family protein [Pseudomonadales bacterium]